MTQEPSPSNPGETAAPTQPYEPPRLALLGTLADLTRGGSVGEPDGAGYAGASGLI